ncbi:MAG: efflux RND transporter periplasmic adaptor subunit [Wenzhouxiangella sp.]|jgi:HlyD family secretion protein|nr:efflux RND transporter periplasmic adaptor subunit [Wenzhouxiangella sp.]
MDIIRPELKTRRKRRQIAWASVAVVALVALTLFILNLDPALPAAPRASAWIGTVERGSFTREVRGPGSLVPKVVRWVAADSGGRVERIIAKPGVQVEPETVLVELSNPALAQQLEEARWAAEAARADRDSLAAELDRSLLEAQSGMAALRSDAESAKLQAEAEEELSARGIVSVIQFRQSQLRAEQLKTRVGLETERLERLGASNRARLAAEDARVEQARRLVQRREEQVAGLRITAGMAGVLQEIAVEPGQRVELGGNVARVAQPEELIAELRIAETQAREIRLGQAVRVDTRNGIAEGSVMRIDPAVQNGTVQVDVELNGALPAGARPDLSVDGTIELERLEDVLHVGRPATGQPDGRASLYRLIDDEVAERVLVELGRASVGRIEIRAGLNEGDRVILSDMSQWSEHDRVALK